MGEKIEGSEKELHQRMSLFLLFRKAFLYILRGSDYREKGGRAYFLLLQAGDKKGPAAESSRA